MRKTSSVSGNISSQAYFNTAKKVFSAASLEKLKARGAAFIERGGDGIHILDEDGGRCIDCYSGAGSYNLGRKNPVLMNELRAAAREIDQGNFVMISEQKALMGKRIDDFLYGPLECILPGVVRGEGIDAACKLARGYTGRGEIVTVDGGWYGQTGFALTLSRRVDKNLFGNLIPSVTTVSFGDIAAAKKAITRKTAAFILEPVQAENHCRAAGAEYMKAVRRLCSSKGAILILDETQTGFGRTGARFAYEQFNIIPDILVYGEAVTGGVFPMTGIAFTRKLKSFFDDHPLIHLCTFGGHDVGCRVAIAAMDEYDRVKPWQNALLMGKKLREKADAVREKYQRIIKSVSGAGLLLSLELETPSKAEAFCASLHENGVFAVPGEVAKNCVVLRPSLLIDSDEIGAIAVALEKTAAMF